MAILITLASQYLAPWLPLAYAREAIITGEWWRLFSGGWLHHNLAHMGMNLAAMCLIYYLFKPVLSGWYWLWVTMLEVLLVNLCLLLFMPSTLNYWGLSGALHGLFVFCCIRSWQRGEACAKWWFIGLGGKLLFDLTRQDEATAHMIGIRVHVESHLWGTLTGIGLAVFVILFFKAKQKYYAGNQ